MDGGDGKPYVGTNLKTPKAAAIAGILFCVLRPCFAEATQLIADEGSRAAGAGQSDSEPPDAQLDHAGIVLVILGVLIAMLFMLQQKW